MKGNKEIHTQVKKKKSEKTKEKKDAYKSRGVEYMA